MKQIITDCDIKFDNVRDLVNFVVLTQKVKSQLDNKSVNVNFGKNAEYYQKMLTEFTNLFYQLTAEAGSAYYYIQQLESQVEALQEQLNNASWEIENARYDREYYDRDTYQNGW